MRASAKKMLAQGPVEGKWDLPVGWEWKRLGEVCPANRKKIHPATKPELPYIGMEHIEPHTGAQCGQDIFGHMKSTGVHFFPGDVLYGRLRPYLSKVFLARHEGACSPEFIVFEENNSLSNEYLGYFLRSGDFVNFASHPDNTSGERPRIDYDTIAAHPIPLPPTIQDQERIVERIDSLFAELDKAEETLRHTITLCEQYKQSVLKAAVTGELSKEWRKANPPKETGEQLLHRILKERRAAWEKAELAKMTAKGQNPANDNWKKKYKEPQAPDTSELPELPEGWTWASVDALSLEVQYGTSEKANEDSSGVPVLRMGNIVDGALTWDKLKYLPEKEDTLSLLLNDGDLLFNRTNSLELVGKTAVFRGQRKATFASYLIRVVTYGIVPEFLSSYINSAIGREWIISVASQQVGQANVNGSKLKQLLVPVPRQKEQSVICNKIQHLIESKVDVLKQIQDMLQQTTALRQSILKQAFTGKLA